MFSCDADTRAGTSLIYGPRGKKIKHERVGDPYLAGPPTPTVSLVPPRRPPPWAGREPTREMNVGHDRGRGQANTHPVRSTPRDDKTIAGGGRAPRRRMVAAKFGESRRGVWEIIRSRGGRARAHARRAECKPSFSGQRTPRKTLAPANRQGNVARQTETRAVRAVVFGNTRAWTPAV